MVQIVYFRLLQINENKKSSKTLLFFFSLKGKKLRLFNLKGLISLYSNSMASCIHFSIKNLITTLS